MHTLCLSTSAIPPISENRRRLMQYTHKDTCNNQMLPHPTTPLGTLTHKTPPQHNLAGNSWTTSDLRVMSIVLGLLDTPSYNANFMFREANQRFILKHTVISQSDSESRNTALSLIASWQGDCRPNTESMHNKNVLESCKLFWRNRASTSIIISYLDAGYKVVRRKFLEYFITKRVAPNAPNRQEDS